MWEEFSSWYGMNNAIIFCSWLRYDESLAYTDYHSALWCNCQHIQKVKHVPLIVQVTDRCVVALVPKQMSSFNIPCSASFPRSISRYGQYCQPKTNELRFVTFHEGNSIISRQAAVDRDWFIITTIWYWEDKPTWFKNQLGAFIYKVENCEWTKVKSRNPSVAKRDCMIVLSQQNANC